jgi:hypothetical protein
MKQYSDEVLIWRSVGIAGEVVVIIVVGLPISDKSSSAQEGGQESLSAQNDGSTPPSGSFLFSVSIRVMWLNSFANDLQNPFPTDRGHIVKLPSYHSFASNTFPYETE